MDVPRKLCCGLLNTKNKQSDAVIHVVMSDFMKSCLWTALFGIGLGIQVASPTCIYPPLTHIQQMSVYLAAHLLSIDFTCF